MKRYPEYPSTARNRLLLIALAACLALPLPAQSATVALATSPLATSTTSTVKPNVLLVLDNSGSMDWDHMPDDDGDGGSAVSFNFGYYGLRSSQCNQVYYNPVNDYLPPLYSDGTTYPDATFTSAYGGNAGGYAGTPTTVNLSTSFIASEDLNADSSGQTAYYYSYAGTQTTQAQKYYHSTSNTFYNECSSSQNVSPGQDVFTKVILSSAATTTATITVGGTSSTSVSGIKLNGTQEIMAGTAAATTTSSVLATSIAAQINLCTSTQTGNCSTAGGHGYTATVSSSTVTITGLSNTASTLTVTRGNTGTMSFSPTIILAATSVQKTNFANWYSYYRTRMQMMKTATGRAFSSLSNNYRVGMMKISETAPVVYVDTFETTHRDDWYDTLYNMVTSGSTPLRRSLADAGRYYAGQLAGTDPLQYSCQQNFTILSTDGYWNTGDGYKIDGSTFVGNQDGTAARPMYDGAQSVDTWLNTYTRIDYSKVTDICTGGKKRMKSQPQIGSCTVLTAGASCTPATWSNDGAATYSGTCSSSFSLPSPDPSTKVLQSSVATIGTTGGSSDNLADIAMYYYQTDLRTSTLGNCTGSASVDVCENNVFIGGNDNNLQQHMTTFTLGLGASGWMNYSSSYLTDTSGDYVAVKLGSTASSTVCTWQASGTVCNWPLPGMTGSDGLIANIDDLWHGAVNGRGAYFSATDPTSLSSGLSNALAGINMRKGAAAAAATSTLNPVAGNNFAYVASYTTVAWKGNLESRGINTDTGAVSENATWCVENVPAGTCAAPGTIVAETSGDTTAYYCVTTGVVVCAGGILDGTNCKIPVATACTGTMNTKVSDTSDSRTIKTPNSTGTGLIDFTHATLSTAQKSYFAAAHIGTLSQWSSLTGSQQTAAEGVNLVNYLRGQYGHEDRTSNLVDDRLYRYREAVLGDALESQPAFIANPVFDYPYAGYTDYKTTYAGRAGTVYMGANDGMMHAIAADTGIERWAYVPSIVIPNMWKLADMNYAALHINLVNGSAAISDVCTSGCGDAATATWKTILVAGLNGGGRGYYALDITDPTSPSLLWEFTTMSGVGALPGYDDDDVGFGFGQAIITQKDDGTWVVLVTSGYNNISPGDGKGYLYVLDAGSGSIIDKLTTNTGGSSDPSGLSKIAGFNNEPGGNRVGYIYGGDLEGNVWRFDINTGAVFRFATLLADNGTAQAITTTPVLGKINDIRYVFISTGKYLETADLSTTQQHTMYSIKDDDATTTLTNARGSLVEQVLSNNPDGTATRVSTNNTVNPYTSRGCYVDFPDVGERANIDAKLVQGILIAPSIVPSNTACSPGGYGWLNYFDYETCGGTSIKYDSTIVGINVVFIDGDPVVEVVTSTDPTPDIPDAQPDYPTPPFSFFGRRTLWRELIQ